MGERHPMAGKQVCEEMLVNIPALVSAYYSNKPDPWNKKEQIEFGTSGHRGSSFKNSFNEEHILAISQAIAEYRQMKEFSGPLFLGKDTHALSEPAFNSALEVLAANGVEVIIQAKKGYTPTPVISQAILDWNFKGGKKSDGIVITPSHNPPEDGGFKYNPPEGGPADTETTAWIENRANELLTSGLKELKRINLQKARQSGFVQEKDFVLPYVRGLKEVLDLEGIAQAGIKIGVDPLGGSGLDYWEVIAKEYGLNIELVNKRIDPSFSFMYVDRDGKVRMDCSSEFAMAGLISMKDKFDIAFGNDPDYDRHGIVTKSGLLNPNHYLAAAAWYLFSNRGDWGRDVALGKTLVTSSMLDRVALKLGRRVLEVPVGFKWFVQGLLQGEMGFAGEESAGASFLRKDSRAWSTDKDGIIMDLLAAEIMAKTMQDPGQVYQSLEYELGKSIYKRIEAPANPEQKSRLKRLSAEDVDWQELAGEKIEQKLTKASGWPVGGLKVSTANGWFAARPSGTENIYKIYAESFNGEKHLEKILDQAQELVNGLL